jgi:Zn-dependent peptidase ImmA (M78 family)/transcriptional regulator with XRE-family HTH domain
LHAKKGYLIRPMPKVVPDVLIWARETAGLSVEAAAKKLGISPRRLTEFESGDREPTRNQLVVMSKRYFRPLLTFYLSRRPSDAERPRDFRSLPEHPPLGSEALVSTLIRDVLSRQYLVKAALEELDESTPIDFVASARMADGADSVVASLQRILGITRVEFRAQKTIDGAFSLLRSSAEKAGIFVVLMGNLGTHHTDIDVRVFRGFALADKIAPFVVINEKDSHSAWSFTLLHELVHIVLGATGISGYDGNAEIEKFCDTVAASFLLSPSELSEIQLADRPNSQTLSGRITAFSDARHLSRKMVAYNLLSANRITGNVYQELSSIFDAERRVRKQDDDNEGGPNYYVVKRHRLGAGLISSVNRMISAGALSTPKAGVILGVKPTAVYTLIGQDKAA